MDALQMILAIASNIGNLGWVVGVVVLYKTGVLQVLFKKNEEAPKDFSKDICELGKHAKVANEEMGDVKNRLTSIETKMDIIMRHLKI